MGGTFGPPQHQSLFGLEMLAEEGSVGIYQFPIGF